jgi:alkylhydroperoxidase family enzyme
MPFVAGSPETLSQALQGAAVDVATLQRRYGAQLAIGRKVLGVVPNCHAYLEIWPVGLRTYNLLVPNFLNLPFLLFGLGPPKDTVGLAMYSASRAAGCAYCTAHSCAFALRRGADEDHMARVAGRYQPEGDASGAERSALDVAEALASVPSSLTEAQRTALGRSFSRPDAEWLVLAVAMMGFLNKFMDAMGIPLEQSMLATAQAVIGPSGWTPGKHGAANGADPTTSRPRPDRPVDLLSLLPLLPALIYRDKRWTSGVPHSWPAAGRYLRTRTGYDFPILSQLTHGRAIRALATILADNTDADCSSLGPRVKHLAGLVYATTVADDALANSARILARQAGATSAQLNGNRDGIGKQADAALVLTQAAASSPAQITPDLVATITAELSPPAIIELMVWIAVLQILHRLHAFYC